MLPNIFIGKKDAPTDAELAAAIGATKPLWDKLTAELGAELGITIREWNSYSVKAGWALRLKRQKRTIVYLGPCAGCFRVSFVLGGRAMLAARKTKLPAHVRRCLDEGTKYPEGTGVLIEVKGPLELEGIKELAAIKLAC